MRVLGIETSCDETGVALFCTERGLLAHQVYSQVALHAAYGGVVPELASRDHVRKTLPLVRAVLREAQVDKCWWVQRSAAVWLGRWECQRLPSTTWRVIYSRPC